MTKKICSKFIKNHLMVCLIRTFSYSNISRFVSFSPDILRQLLEHELVVDLVDHVEGENGRAPLHFAAKFNHTEIAKELLQHGAKPDREDVTGKSPIYMAACAGHANMLKVFLDHGKLLIVIISGINVASAGSAVKAFKNTESFTT